MILRAKLRFFIDIRSMWSVEIDKNVDFRRHYGQSLPHGDGGRGCGRGEAAENAGPRAPSRKRRGGQRGDGDGGRKCGGGRRGGGDGGRGCRWKQLRCNVGDALELSGDGCGAVSGCRGEGSAVSSGRQTCRWCTCSGNGTSVAPWGVWRPRPRRRCCGGRRRCGSGCMWHVPERGR